MRNLYTIWLCLLCVCCLPACVDVRSTSVAVKQQPLSATDSLKAEKQAYKQAAKELKKRQKALRRNKHATQEQHEQLKTDYIALQQWYLEILNKEKEQQN